MAREMVVPEGKPAFEWILGRPVQKVSPKRRHSLLQAEFVMRLRPWADGRGEIGTEWRFRLEPPGEDMRPFVPDVAYLSYERMGERTDAELETPLLAPNAAIDARFAAVRRRTNRRVRAERDSSRSRETLRWKSRRRRDVNRTGAWRSATSPAARRARGERHARSTPGRRTRN